MTVSNVSTYYSLQGLLQNVAKNQGSLNDDQIAISSGYKSQTYDGLNGEVEQYTSLNSHVTRLQTYQQNNTIYISQLQTTNTALNQIQQTANSVKNLIINQMSGINGSASFIQQMKSNLTTLSTQLNLTFQGNYLFGGTKTNTPPVPAQIIPSTGGVPDPYYYQGSTQNSSTLIADGQQVDNSIRADDIAFQQIIAGIGQAINSSTGATESLKHAEDLINTGIQGVIALSATVNATILNVQQTNGQLNTIQTYYTSLAENISNSDTVVLSAKVTQDQTILQASFSVYARISQLRLSDYLK